MGLRHALITVWIICWCPETNKSLLGFITVCLIYEVANQFEHMIDNIYLQAKTHIEKKKILNSTHANEVKKSIT